MTLESAKFASETLPPFELKGSLFTLTVMYLREVDKALIARHLHEKIRQAPGLFGNTPVVIDLEPLAESNVTVDFAGLNRVLREHGMIPVGVRNGGVILQAAATLAGLPLLPESRSGAPAPGSPTSLNRRRLVTVRSLPNRYARASKSMPPRVI